jgi:hypothetical protein
MMLWVSLKAITVVTSYEQLTRDAVLVTPERDSAAWIGLW